MVFRMGKGVDMFEAQDFMFPFKLVKSIIQSLLIKGFPGQKKDTDLSLVEVFERLKQYIGVFQKYG